MNSIWAKQPDLEDRFIIALRTHRMVTAACEAVGITTQTAYLHRRENTPFRERWLEVARVFRLDLKDSVMSRATYGWLEPVYYKGKVVGQKRVFCSKLSQFMMQVHGFRPPREDGNGPTPQDQGAGSSSAGEDLPTTLAELIAADRERDTKAAEPGVQPDTNGTPPASTSRENTTPGEFPYL